MYIIIIIVNYGINLGCSGEKWMRYVFFYMYIGFRFFIIIIK